MKLIMSSLAAIALFGAMHSLEAYTIEIANHSSRTLWVAPYQRTKKGDFVRLDTPQLFPPAVSLLIKNMRKNTKQLAYFLLGSSTREQLTENITDIESFIARDNYSLAIGTGEKQYAFEPFFGVHVE